MSAFPRICLGCKRTFRPQATDQRHCPACASTHYRRQLIKRQRQGKRTGSTRAWRKLRAQILASNPPCAYCGVPASTVDHRVPVSKGGAELDPANCVPACAACNARKGAG